MKEALAEILKRVESWPEVAQDEAAASLRWIERELIEPYQLSDNDKRAVDRGLADLRAGRLASADKVFR